MASGNVGCGLSATSQNITLTTQDNRDTDKSYFLKEHLDFLPDTFSHAFNSQDSKKRAFYNFVIA